ncbi:MAG: class III signal peptide-containing protein, partial [archaeon]
MAYKKPDFANTRAQGAIEYLLIIGAAILIVAVVITALGSSTTTGNNVMKGTQLDQNNNFNNLRSPLETTGAIKLIANTPLYLAYSGSQTTISVLFPSLQYSTTAKVGYSVDINYNAAARTWAYPSFAIPNGAVITLTSSNSYNLPSISTLKIGSCSGAPTRNCSV